MFTLFNLNFLQKFIKFFKPKSYLYILHKLYNKTLRDKNIYNPSVAKIVFSLILNEKQKKNFILDKSYNAESFSVIFENTILLILNDSIKFSDYEKKKLLNNLFQFKDTYSPLVYEMLYSVFFGIHNFEKQYKNFIFKSIFVKNKVEYILLCCLIHRYGSIKDLITYHNNVNRIDWYYQLDKKDLKFCLNVAQRQLYRFGCHDSIKDMINSELSLLDNTPLTAMFTRGINFFFHQRSINMSNKLNQKFNLKEKANSLRVVCQELDLASQVFQLPFIKNQYEIGDIDLLIIDKRLYEFCKFYIPGIKIIERSPLIEIKDELDTPIPPNLYKFVDGLESNYYNKIYFVPINYAYASHSEITISARKKGIFGPFLDTLKLNKNDLIDDMDNKKFMCLSLSSSLTSSFRKNNFEKLIPKIKELIGDHQIINLTPNLSKDELEKLENILNKKVIIPKINLFYDLYQIAFLMSISEFNIVPNNNLMEIGGAVGNKTYVLDHFKRLKYYRVAKNDYFFWSNIEIIN